MDILIVGSGGREHALAWKAAQSPMAETVFVAPGNAGTANEPKVQNIPIAAEDIQGLRDFALNRSVGLTIVGPEMPLVAGIVDDFRTAGLRCLGPTQAAARLEGSKSFTKDFLARHGIPTATYQTFIELDAALDYLHKVGTPIVVKADGLAAGKGVVVAHDSETAETAVRDMLSGSRFGAAGQRVVIEEFLSGEEASFIVLTDGQQVLPMASSQDHKPIGEGDRGPNTGGMGAYSPAPVITPDVHTRIMQEIISPTIQGMAEEGCPYSGFLYAGLMIGESEGEAIIKVIEYNCRFGDPETQPIMLRLQSDLVQHCLAAEKGRLAGEHASWDPRASLGVVMAAGGYPGKYAKGLPIAGLVNGDPPDTKVFHAGTATRDDRVVTAGGRVLCVTALGATVTEAQQNAYARAAGIRWHDAYYRRDIGHRAVARER